MVETAPAPAPRSACGCPSTSRASPRVEALQPVAGLVRPTRPIVVIRTCDELRARLHDGPCLRVLAVDDELPALEDLAYLLRADRTDRRGRDGPGRRRRAALPGPGARRGRPRRGLPRHPDARPGRAGAGPGARPVRATRPQVVFVTAYEEHAVDAFEIKAMDYLLKPVRAERLAEAVRRVCAPSRCVRQAGAGQAWAGGETAEDETIPVELGGVTRFVAAAEVRYVEAQGDYARLHTADGSHLVRIPLATLEERWADAGFVRIHRSHLVALRHIDEMRMESGRVSVRGRRRASAGEPPVTPASCATGWSAGRKHGLNPAPTGQAARPGTASAVSAHGDTASAVSVTGRTAGTARHDRAARRRVVVTSPDPRHPATRGYAVRHEIDEQTRLGEVYMRSLMRAQLRLGAVRLRRSRAAARRPAAAVRAGAGAAARCRCSGIDAALAAARRAGLPGPGRRRLGSTSGRPSATSGTSPTWSSARDDARA